MTERKHKRNARKLGMTSEQYAEMRYSARVRLDRRMKEGK